MLRENVLKKEIKSALEMEERELTLDTLVSSNLETREPEITNDEIDVEAEFAIDKFKEENEARLKRTVKQKLEVELKNKNLTPEERKVTIRKITLEVYEEFTREFEVRFKKWLDENWEELLKEARARKERLAGDKKEVFPFDWEDEKVEEKKEEEFPEEWNGKKVYPFYDYKKLSINFDDKWNVVSVSDDTNTYDVSSVDPDVYTANFALVGLNHPDADLKTALQRDRFYSEQAMAELIMNEIYITPKRIKEREERERIAKLIEENEIEQYKGKKVEEITEEDLKNCEKMSDVMGNNEEELKDFVNQVLGTKEIDQRPSHLVDDEDAWGVIKRQQDKRIENATSGVDTSNIDITKSVAEIFNVNEEVARENLEKMGVIEEPKKPKIRIPSSSGSPSQDIKEKLEKLKIRV